MIRKIGQYEVLEHIGDGGMGAVFKARDPRFDRIVAVKVLHPQFARSADVVDRFKTEAIIQAKLNHPNIATVHDFIAEGDTLAMIMEFIDGVTLDALIRSAPGGRLDAERASKILTQVLSAVGMAHERALVHRDLKPSNIMVQRFGSDEAAKVMDFGVAKILGAEKVRTATSAKIGTLAYMSPEHIRSPKHVDARADIYSLGIVLYEMLSGALPFDADSEYELMNLIVNVPLRTNEIQHPFGSVIARAAEKDPARRYASCLEFRTALREPVDRSLAVSTYQDVEPPPPAPVAAAVAVSITRARKVTALVVAAGLLVGLFIVALSQPDRRTALAPLASQQSGMLDTSLTRVTGAGTGTMAMDTMAMDAMATDTTDTASVALITTDAMAIGAAAMSRGTSASGDCDEPVPDEARTLAEWDIHRCRGRDLTGRGRDLQLHGAEYARAATVSRLAIEPGTFAMAPWPAADPLRAITVEVCGDVSDVSNSTEYLIGKGADAGVDFFRIFIVARDGGWRIHGEVQGDRGVVSAQTQNLEHPDYMALTYDGKEVVVYVNGERAARAAGVVGAFAADDSPLYLGRHEWRGGASSRLSASVAWARISVAALSREQIAGSYAACKSLNSISVSARDPLFTRFWGIGRRVVREEEIRGLTDRELQLLRNFIYARHGRPFVTREMKDAFSREPWYTPDTTYADGRLTEIDHANVQLLAREERRRTLP